MIEILEALSEPNRLRIVELLRAGPRPVNDIADSLELNQPQVSKHLRVLKHAGLVTVRPRAQQRLYRLRPDPIRKLHAWTERYQPLWESGSDQTTARIEEPKEKHHCDPQDE